jgi:hypothetical protein
MWNHKDNRDPMQKKIEEIITALAPGYTYAAGQEDYAAVIAESGLFTDIEEICAPFLHREHADKVIGLWRSHCSLYRYAGAGFGEVIAAIDQYIHSLGQEYLQIPYTTKAWLARKNDQ